MWVSGIGSVNSSVFCRLLELKSIVESLGGIEDKTHQVGGYLVCSDDDNLLCPFKIHLCEGEIDFGVSVDTEFLFGIVDVVEFASCALLCYKIKYLLFGALYTA